MTILVVFAVSIGWWAEQGAPPPPPGPPAFMGMKGPPLACFSKPAFEQDGLEFFVCNGGGGLAGVRKKADRTQLIFVRNPDIAMNLQMQMAKAQCKTGAFAVRGFGEGSFGFLCDRKEVSVPDRFKAASKADWKKYDTYLDK
jgi:hypothetical protein